MSKLITQVLAEIRGGVFNNEATRQLGELVEAVQASGKKGTISITLTLDPHGKGNREIHVYPKVAMKAPPAPDTMEAGVFFAVRGDLVRDDPDQQKLPLDERREMRDRTGTND